MNIFKQKQEQEQEQKEYIMTKEECRKAAISEQRKKIFLGIKIAIEEGEAFTYYFNVFDENKEYFKNLGYSIEDSWGDYRGDRIKISWLN